MFKLDQIKDGVLKRFMIQIPAGNTLFKQNDKGNTLYIIVEGSVKLVHKVGPAERVISTLRAGEIVGEKALCATAPYRRSFTAIAAEESVALEFDSQSLKAIASKIPDFTVKLLQTVVERLDRTNALVAILQTPNPVEKVAQYFVHHCEHYSTSTGNGVEITLTPEVVQTAINVDLKIITNCIQEWLAQKVIIKKDAGFFVPDENALVQAVSGMKEKLAA